ncbi:hypothetical protein Ancab_030142 [Ancistrocladus abbreviatus]
MAHSMAKNLRSELACYASSLVDPLLSGIELTLILNCLNTSLELVGNIVPDDMNKSFCHTQATNSGHRRERRTEEKGLIGTGKGNDSSNGVNDDQCGVFRVDDGSSTGQW